MTSEELGITIPVTSYWGQKLIVEQLASRKTMDSMSVAVLSTREESMASRRFVNVVASQLSNEVG